MGAAWEMAGDGQVGVWAVAGGAGKRAEVAAAVMVVMG